MAGRTRFGGLIVSGTQTTALLLGLTGSHFSRRGSVVGLGFSVAFERAVGADETVMLEWVVDSVSPAAHGAGQRVGLKGRLLNALGECCASATGTVLVGRDFNTR